MRYKPKTPAIKGCAQRSVCGGENYSVPTERERMNGGKRESEALSASRSGSLSLCLLHVRQVDMSIALSADNACTVGSSARDGHVQCSELLTEQCDVDQEVSVHLAIVHCVRHAGVDCDAHLLQVDVLRGSTHTARQRAAHNTEAAAVSVE